MRPMLFDMERQEFNFFSDLLVCHSHFHQINMKERKTSHGVGVRVSAGVVTRRNRVGNHRGFGRVGRSWVWNSKAERFCSCERSCQGGDAAGWTWTLRFRLGLPAMHQ